MRALHRSYGSNTPFCSFKLDDMWRAIRLSRNFVSYGKKVSMSSRFLNDSAGCDLPTRRSLQIVHAKVQADYGARVMARVQEFGSIPPVPLRPEEHGFRELRVGLAFAGHVTFGPNGPFLRPLTAGPRG